MNSSRPRLTVALVALLIGIFGLSGCTDSPTDISEETSSATPTPAFDPEDSLWSIASTDERLSLDDPDVQELQKVVVLHSGVSDNRSPDTVQASVAAEEESFAPLFLDKLSAQGYGDAVVAMYVDNDLTVQQIGVAWTPSTIDADRQHAKVGFESIFRIVSASDGFLHELDLEPGAEVVQPREYELTKIDGVWLIDDIEKGPLRKAPTMP